jgi:choice-of-anchor C domain-containing protein
MVKEDVRMKRRTMVSGAIAVAASIALAGSALAAFVGITNGSFETGTYVENGPGFEMLPAGSAEITGWTVSSGSIDWIGGLWQAQDGSKSLDLDGDAPGAISQDLATTIGDSYVVSFYLSGNSNGGQAVKTLIVSATGTAPATYTFDASAISNSAMGWRQEGYSFVATSATTTLTFASGDTAGAFGPALDNVVVVETVASDGNCKDGGWQTMTDGQGNGFKNQGDCVSYFASDGRNPGAVAP